MSTDERELVAALKASDAGAFRLVYDRCADRVHAFVLQLTGDASEAEDIVQEVFVAAYRGRDTFQSRSRVLTWLLAIASRRCRDRRRQSRPTIVPLSDDTGLPNTCGMVGRSDDLEASVVESLTLTGALTQLDPAAREAVLLIAQGLTYREAAAVLEEPVGTVKWRVSTATRRLASILSAVEEEIHEM